MSEDFQRSLGLELSGPRSEKTALAVVDYYPKQKRASLSELTLLNDKEVEPDVALIEAVSQACNIEKPLTGMGVHAPLSFPPYLREEEGRKLPKVKHSKNEEVIWMHAQFEKLKGNHQAISPIVPYLQRPCEFFLRHLCPEEFTVSDSFSANRASLAARMRFLQPYFPLTCNETYAKGSLLRICRAMKMPKFVEQNHSSLTHGLEARHEFFLLLQKTLPEFFFYEEHVESMTLHLHLFRAFLSSFTQFMVSKKLCVPAPLNFPENSSWIHLPRSNVDWKKLL